MVNTTVCPAEQDLALPDKTSMHYVYVLKSAVNARLYVGRSDNLRKRFTQHNSGRVKSTKGYMPWTLVYYEAYQAKLDVTKREKQLKMHAAKEGLKKQIQYSLN